MYKDKKFDLAMTLFADFLKSNLENVISHEPIRNVSERESDLRFNTSDSVSDEEFGEVLKRFFETKYHRVRLTTPQKNIFYIEDIGSGKVLLLLNLGNDTQSKKGFYQDTIRLTAIAGPEYSGALLVQNQQSTAIM